CDTSVPRLPLSAGRGGRRRGRSARTEPTPAACQRLPIPGVDPRPPLPDNSPDDPVQSRLEARTAACLDLYAGNGSNAPQVPRLHTAPRPGSAWPAGRPDPHDAASPRHDRRLSRAPGLRPVSGPIHHRVTPEGVQPEAGGRPLKWGDPLS